MINLVDIESINQIPGRGTVIAVDTRKYAVPFDVGMMVNHEGLIFLVDGIETGAGSIVGLQVSALKAAPGKHAWRFSPICPWCGEGVPIPHPVFGADAPECPSCNQNYVLNTELVYQTARVEKFVESSEIEGSCTGACGCSDIGSDNVKEG